MMLTTLKLNQEGNVEQLIIFKKFKFKFHWRDFLAAFPSGFVEEVGLFVVWYLENANIKTAGKNKARENRKE